ncbi:MAG TPA: hypothetical protein ENN03_07125 [bacterium]|nr:hypothetical protein [bacterium]
MTSRQRFLKALNREKPDCLPVTTHHLMDSFLETFMGGMTQGEFFDHFGLDPIGWVMALTADPSGHDFPDSGPILSRTWPLRRIASEQWRFRLEELKGEAYPATRFNIVTPKKTLSMILQSGRHTTWVAEPLIKEKRDIDLVDQYMVCPVCDREAVNESARKYGEKGLIRGHVIGFDGYGQPGCWQDLACLVGTEKLILATFDDPQWVHRGLQILQRRKKTYIESLKGVRYDLIELGGGDASTTVISPRIFNEFVAPYDEPLIKLAHEMGQRVVYHTCGGMMPILEDIAAMKPDAMETFTPPTMGGDADLALAKNRIGDRVCMIGGFDQFHFFQGCDPAATRKEVRRCFEEAGREGGYILCPSDHFFEADPELIRAYAEAARGCVYERREG